MTLNIKEAGTLTLIDGYTDKSISKKVSAGTTTIYNLTPGAISKFIVTNSSNKIVQMGTIKPTGNCRMLYIPNVYNMRDLGGWTCDGGTVKYNMLFRGGQIDNAITDDGLRQALHWLGILKEIDLRFPEDLNGRTESAFGGPVDMTWVDMTWNQLSYQKTSGNIKAIFDPLFDAIINNEPTYFHCSAGADRTGVIALICEAVLGMSQSDIDKDYELTCFATGVSTDAEARRRNENIWTREINYINTFNGSSFRNRVIQLLIECGITIDKINAYRKAMIDGTPETITVATTTRTITNNLTGVTNSNSATSIPEYQPYSATLTPEKDKIISNIVVKMGGTDITSQVFTGTIGYRRASVTYNLTNCTSSYTKTYAIEGQAFSTTITPTDNLEIKNVTITMGGTDVSTYYTNGTITIPSVTGDIVITATAAEQAPAYTNQLDNAIDMNGNKIGRTAMYTNMRYNSSSGDPVAYSGNLITGLIPYKNGDVVRIRWSGSTDYTQSIKLFKSDRTQTATGYYALTNLGKLGATIDQADYTNGIFDFTINTFTNGGVYMAVCLHETDINNVIITINEEIT